MQSLEDPVGDLVPFMLVFLDGSPLLRNVLELLQHPLQRLGSLMDVARRLTKHLEELLAAGKKPKSYHDVPLLVFGRRRPPGPVAPEEPAGARHQDDRDDDIQGVQDSSHPVPVLAQKHSRIGQDPTPGQGPQEGVEQEAAKWNPGHAGRKRDEGPDDRQQATGEGRRHAVTGKPPIGPCDLVRGDQYVPPVLEDKLPPPIGPGGVGQRGAEGAPDGPRQRDAPEREAALADQVAGERHDDFAGQWDAGALDGHGDRNTAVPETADDPYDKPRQWGQNQGEEIHGNSHIGIGCRRRPTGWGAFATSSERTDAP